MERSKRFYTDLGWKVQNDYKISVFFVPHGGSLVGFYGRDGLAEMVGVSADSSGFSGVVFNYIVRSEGRVDEVLDEAKKAGATILKPAATLQWGGYGGTFADPDGYIWSIGYSAQGKDRPRRRVAGELPRARRRPSASGAWVWISTSPEVKYQSNTSATPSLRSAM